MYIYQFLPKCLGFAKRYPSTCIISPTELALSWSLKMYWLIVDCSILIEMFTLSDVQGKARQVERQRERWEKRQHRRRQRSISREKWVETLVVADPKMVEYYGKDGTESYVLAVMNIVSISLFRLFQLRVFLGGVQTWTKRSWLKARFT